MVKNILYTVICMSFVLFICGGIIIYTNFQTPTTNVSLDKHFPDLNGKKIKLKNPKNKEIRSLTEIIESIDKLRTIFLNTSILLNAEKLEEAIKCLEDVEDQRKVIINLSGESNSEKVDKILENYLAALNAYVEATKALKSKKPMLYYYYMDMGNKEIEKIYGEEE